VRVPGELDSGAARGAGESGGGAAHRLTAATSELHEQGEVQPRLGPAQIGSEAGHERAWGPSVASGRRHAAGTGKIRNARHPMIPFAAEGDELIGHIVERR